MRTLRRRWLRPRASTLVITLLVIVVLSTIVVAFMQSMAIERMVSRSYANRYRAELAAEAGVDTAMRLLHVGTTNNLGFAVIKTNVGTGFQPILLVAQRESQHPSNLIPLVSGPIAEYLQSRNSDSNALATFLGAATNTNYINAVDVNRLKEGFRLISNETGVERHNAPWVYLTNSSGETNARFAFVVLDQQEKLNLAVHGKSYNSDRAGWESDARKVPVTIPGSSRFLSGAQAINYASFPFTNFHAEHLGQIFSNRSDFESKKHLYTYNEKTSEDFIPAGYIATNGIFVAYADAGRPKYNINDLATNAAFGSTPYQRATNLAGIIDRNLPSLKQRDVSLTAENDPAIRYIQRLAASIVDYVDTDSSSTLLDNDEPAGKELAPVITSIAEKYNWISESGSGSSWTNQIKHTVFVQVWNPYQTNVSGSMRFELNTLRQVEIPGAILVPMLPVSGTNTVDLRVNEYKVFEFGSSVNVITSLGPQASANQTNYPKMAQTSSSSATLPRHSRFKAYWDGILFDYTANDSPFYDSSAPGLVKEAVGASAATRIALMGTNRFSINYPQYGFYDATKGYRSAADPRQNYLANYVWDSAPATDTNVRWNGRNNLTTALRQDYQTVWAARDAPRTNSRVGSYVGLADPTTATTVWQASDTNSVFAFIRNADMKGIGELGNIYDPACLNDVGFATDGGNPSSWYASGGGRTLRIGYSEFDYPGSPATSGSERKAPSWSAPGVKSTHLLDIFSINGTNADGVGTRLGKININTAHPDVLQALFYNLGQVADPSFTNSKITTNAAASIAAAVISNRPYWRLSDISKFGSNIVHSTNFSPLLGTYSNYPAPIMDPGREQVLSSVLDLFDTQTRTFKVVVIGQSLTKAQKVAGEAVLQSIIEVRTKKDGSTYFPEIIKSHTYLQ